MNKKNKKRKKIAGSICGSAVLSLCVVTTAYATGGDPLTIVNNIILGWGIVQVGMSIQSHDASQRTQGLLCLFGGLLIAFAKEILTLIGAV